MEPLKIVFLGLPLAALLLHHDGHTIQLACISREDAVGRRRLKRLVGPAGFLDRPTLDTALIARVRALAPDLVVSWFWTNRIPTELASAARFGGIGVHPSLLPRHRGPDPTSWAILCGDLETGVTCHRIAAEYDTGPILGALRHPISPESNAWQLARELDRPSLRLLRETCRRFARGEPMPELPQDESLATTAPQSKDDDLEILWDQPSDLVLRQIRAYAPSPGAFTYIGDEVVTVLAARPLAVPSGLLETPGEAVFLKGSLLIRTRDADISILSAELGGKPLGPADLGRLLRG